MSDTQKNDDTVVVVPCRKKLKSAEPDLKITCKGGGGGDRVAMSKTFECYSMTMAKLSNVFDTMLASGMQEAQTKHIILEDVDPETFDLAMTIVEDRDRWSKATVQEIMTVAPFYNQYEITEGLDHASAVLCNFLSGWRNKLFLHDEKNLKTPTKSEMDVIIQVILVGDRAAIQKVVDKSVDLLVWLFNSESLHGQGLFSLESIKELQQFIASNPQSIIHFNDRYYSLPGGQLSKRAPKPSDPDFCERLYSKFLSLNILCILEKMGLKFDLEIEFMDWRSFPYSSKKEKVTLEMERAEFEGKRFVETADRENARITNIKLFHVDESYVAGPEFDCDRFDWTIEFSFDGDDHRFVCPWSRSDWFPPPAGKRWVHTKGRNQNTISIQSITAVPKAARSTSD